MSMTMIAFLDSKAFPENKKIEDKIRELGYEFKFLEGFDTDSMENDVSCSINGHDAYVQCYIETADEVLEEFSWIKPRLNNEDIAISFIWGTDAAEAACISLISLALISLSKARVYYTDDEMEYTYDMLLEEMPQSMADLEREEKIQVQEKPKSENILSSLKKLFIPLFKQNNQVAKTNKKSDWENLKVYHNLDKKDNIQVFKKFGQAIYNNLTGYNLIQVYTMIKFSRTVNNLEQAVFIERNADKLEVKICIKPVDFYDPHEFSMINQVPLGNILNNHHRTNFPLTKEWELLSEYLSEKISNEIDLYFERYNSYDKIILYKTEIEPKYEKDTDNIYPLLIYAAIYTQNKSYLVDYIDKKLSSPISISKTEHNSRTLCNSFNIKDFFENIRDLAIHDNFEQIRREIEHVNNCN